MQLKVRVCAYVCAPSVYTLNVLQVFFFSCAVLQHASNRPSPPPSAADSNQDGEKAAEEEDHSE